VPPGFDRVLSRALAKAPEDRYPSAGDFGRAALAAAEGRSVTEEERSVARGAAAPTIRREGRLWSGPGEPVVPEPVEEPPPAPIRRYRARPPGRVWAWGSGVVAVAGAALAIAVVPGGAGTPPPGEPVSSSEVRRLANSFASAYADEDEGRISRLLTSDAQRVSVADRQSGRKAVVAAYHNQFANNQTTDFELADLEAVGGASGRATARYTASYKGKRPTTGTMTWTVIRERGRPRITLIAAEPD
jgi:ketosteroid isomerase-like protein